MKSFVIYLTVFFIVTIYIRGFLGLDNYKFYKNPNLAKLETSKKNSKSHIVKNIEQRIKHQTYNSNQDIPLLDFSISSNTDLLPIEEKYLNIGFKKHLAKEWFSKKLNREKFKVVVSIKRNSVSKRKYVSTYKGKRHYIIEQKVKININYKVYNSKGLTVAKGFIPYNVFIKSDSKWDYLESERIAKKKLFLNIGQKIANSLNAKRFSILKL